MSSCTLPKFQPKFVENPVDFRPLAGGGTLREVSGRLWKPPAAQGRFVDIFLWISVSFWGPIWTPFRHLWAFCFALGAFMLIFVVLFLVPLKKERKSY